MNAATMDSAGRDLHIIGKASPSLSSSLPSSPSAPSSSSSKRRRGSLKLGKNRSTSPGRGLFRKASSFGGNSKSALTKSKENGRGSSKSCSNGNIKGSNSDNKNNERDRSKATLLKNTRRNSSRGRAMNDTSRGRSLDDSSRGRCLDDSSTGHSMLEMKRASKTLPSNEPNPTLVSSSAASLPPASPVVAVPVPVPAPMPMPVPMPMSVPVPVPVPVSVSRDTSKPTSILKRASTVGSNSSVIESATVGGAKARKRRSSRNRDKRTDAASGAPTMETKKAPTEATRGRLRNSRSDLEGMSSRRRANSLEDGRWQNSTNSIGGGGATQDLDDSLSTSLRSRRSSSLGSDGRPRSSMTVRTLEESLSKTAGGRRDAARVRRSIRRMSSQEKLDALDCSNSARSGVSSAAPPSVRSFYSKLERANSMSKSSSNLDESSGSTTRRRSTIGPQTVRTNLNDAVSLASCSHLSLMNGEDELSVSFKNVEIREYPITIGDNPSVSGGPPITIDWEPQDEQVEDIDEYESHRPTRRHSAEMAVPKILREDIIRNAGVSPRDLTKCTRDVNISRRQRRRTLETLSNAQMDETIERTKRGLRNAFRKSTKKKEKEMIQRAIQMDRKNGQYRNKQAISDEIEDSIVLHEMEMAVEMDMLFPFNELSQSYSNTVSAPTPPAVICIEGDDRNPQ